MNHLTEQQVLAYVRGDMAALAEYEAVDRHVHACDACRKLMGQTAAETSPALRRSIADALHPTGDEVFAYARRGLAAVSPGVASHIVRCPDCRSDAAYSREYRAVLADAGWSEARRVLRRGLAAQAAGKEPSRMRSWLSVLASQVFTAAAPVGRPSAAFRFATGVEAPPSVEVELGDGQGTAALVEDAGGRRLHVEHKTLPVGALVLVEGTDGDGETVFQRFAVLRKGFRRSVAEIVLSDDRVDGCTLSVGMVEPASIDAGAAECIASAYAQSVAVDPASEAAWREWAEGVARSRRSSPASELAARILQ